MAELPVVDRIHPQSSRLVSAVKNKATGDSKVNDWQPCASPHSARTQMM